MCGLAVPSKTTDCPALGANTASNEYSWADPCERQNGSLLNAHFVPCIAFRGLRTLSAAITSIKNITVIVLIQEAPAI